MRKRHINIQIIMPLNIEDIDHLWWLKIPTDLATDSARFVKLTEADVSKARDEALNVLDLEMKRDADKR